MTSAFDESLVATRDLTAALREHAATLQQVFGTPDTGTVQVPKPRRPSDSTVLDLVAHHLASVEQGDAVTLDGTVRFRPRARALLDRLMELGVIK